MPHASFRTTLLLTVLLIAGALGAAAASGWIMLQDFARASREAGSGALNLTSAMQQIDERLNDRFALLTRGRRTSLQRHQTLRSLIDWSHDLLGEQERALLRRLSQFAGGWTLEAAEAVCSAPPIERNRVLDLLSTLVDALTDSGGTLGLVVATGAAVLRYKPSKPTAAATAAMF